MQRSRWIHGLIVLATGAVVWSAFIVGREEDPVGGARPTRVEGPEPGPRPGELPVSGQRTAALVHPASTPAVEPVPVIAGEAVPIPRSPLARDLDDVAASFLTHQPRVTDLLDLVEQMASLAVVEPDSVTIQRSAEGELLSARGTLAMGDVRGTFLVDPDGYRVMLRSGTDDAAYSQRDIHITFEEDGSDPRSCHVVVQFQPREVETPTGARAGEQERLVGWTVGTSPEKGTHARPLTLSLAEGGWEISDSTRVLEQEFPWVADVGGFGAWLRLLRPKDASPAQR